jgi:GNAT superfamily N-acetyltransferase
MEAVREAVPGDAQRFAELRDEFRTTVTGHRGGPLAVDPGPDPLAVLLEDPAHLVLMATLDSVVTGFAHGHVLDLEGHGRRGVLDACFVEPEARGVGLGRLLLDEVMTWLGGQGCPGVDGVALPGDRTAKNFYEAAGFKARLLTMYRPLGE